MLEVGQYGLVWHIGTSLAGLKPYRHFFETTAIHTNSSVATKCGFWTQNIADMCLQPWIQEGQIQVGMEGKGEREGEERGREGRGIGPYWYFFFVTSTPVYKYRTETK